MKRGVEDSDSGDFMGAVKSTAGVHMAAVWHVEVPVEWVKGRPVEHVVEVAKETTVTKTPDASLQVIGMTQRAH